MNCALCKGKIPDEKILFRDECDHCGGDLHICLNCTFYDPHASRECREPAIPDAVHNKERKNLCEYFVQKEGQGGTGEPVGDDARRKLEALFK